MIYCPDIFMPLSVEPAPPLSQNAPTVVTTSVKDYDLSETSKAVSLPYSTTQKVGAKRTFFVAVTRSVYGGRHDWRHALLLQVHVSTLPSSVCFDLTLTSRLVFTTVNLSSFKALRVSNPSMTQRKSPFTCWGRSLRVIWHGRSRLVQACSVVSAYCNLR